MAGDRPREPGVRVGRLGQRAPAARWLRVVLGWSVAAVGLLAAVGCRLQLPTGPTEVYTGCLSYRKPANAGKRQSPH